MCDKNLFEFDIKNKKIKKKKTRKLIKYKCIICVLRHFVYMQVHLDKLNTHSEKKLFCFYLLFMRQKKNDIIIMLNLYFKCMYKCTLYNVH